MLGQPFAWSDRMLICNLQAAAHSQHSKTHMLSQAVFEAVLPRQSGDAIPKTPAGILVAVADRLDSLVGLWAAGEAPRSSADPFGLRRSAYGMLQVNGHEYRHTTLKPNYLLLMGAPTKAVCKCPAVTILFCRVKSQHNDAGC